MKHLELLRWIARQRGARSFLEIGCGPTPCWPRMPVAVAIGVDPYEGGTVVARSEDYWHATKQHFDLVFIDGDHTCEAVLTDVLNALDHLNEGGAVVVHDVLPVHIEETRQLEPNHDYLGDGWRVIASLARHPALDVAVGNIDYGCAVILPRQDKPGGVYQTPSIRSWTWEQYEAQLRGVVPLFRVLEEGEFLRWISARSASLV